MTDNWAAVWCWFAPTHNGEPHVHHVEPWEATGNGHISLNGALMGTHSDHRNILWVELKLESVEDRIFNTG